MDRGSDIPAPSPEPEMGSGQAALNSGKQIEEIKIEVSPADTLPSSPPASDTAIRCSLRQTGNGGGKGWRLQEDRLVLDEFEGPFCIRLKLKGGLKWRAGDPLWIARDRCPERPQIDHEQIWLDKNPKNDTIVLLDMNVGEPCTLHYRMNFEGNLHCDPIVDNRGGGTVARF